MAQPENASAESWISQVKRTFDPTHKMWQVSEEVCIYRVVEPIRVSKPEAYVPLVVSFGPYHHKTNPKSSVMDQYKLEAFHRTLARLKRDVTSLIAEIQKLDKQIRECYAEPIEWDGETLSYMLAMDACFILDFFTGNDTFSLVFQHHSSNSMTCAILDDIIKLENQIPLFILITILQLQYGTREDAITHLAAMLMSKYEFRGFPFTFSQDDESKLKDKSKLKEYMMNERPPYHLLDLYRMMIKDLLTNSSPESGTAVEPHGWRGTGNINNDHGPCEWVMNVALPDRRPLLSPALSSDDNSSASSVKSSDDNSFASSVKSSDDSRSTPTATLLQKAGIKFQPGQLRFEKSTLSLPQIIIGDNTEILLRNLMAYEECQRCSRFPEETIISHFVALFDDLINSAKDVSVLRNSLVIKSFLGNDEDIARILNRLGDGITRSSIEQIKVEMEKASKHYNSKWKVWMSQCKSQLKEEYFSKPWSLISFSGAILALFMTAVQTVYSLKN